MLHNAPSRQSQLLLSGGGIVCVIGLAGLSAIFLPILPASSLADGTFSIVMATAVFTLLLCFIAGSATVRCVDHKRIAYRLALLVWWFLLVDEVYFTRRNNGYNMGQGAFPVLAYGEGAMWVLSFLVLILISLRHRTYLYRLFSGSTKWLSLFIVICLLSITYAPGKLYAVAWGFKLLLVVLILQLCVEQMRDVADIVSFLNVTLGAYVVLSVVPVIDAFTDPVSAFDEGRLNANPDLLTPTAASLLIMAMTLHSIRKKDYLVVIGFVSAVTMFLAFGKAGILGGVLGAGLFMLMQKKILRGVGLLTGLTVLAILIVSVTPVAGYLANYHGMSTLTGRTLVWAIALPAIKEKPIWGHGYLGSYYAWKSTSGLVVGDIYLLHLHNGFLDVAYNSGIVGEVSLLIVHFVILRNIVRSIRASRMLRVMQPQDEQARCMYVLTIGILAQYVHLLIQGLFDSEFGGRCMSTYMLFLAVFVMADTVRRINLGMLSRAMCQKNSHVRGNEMVGT